VKSSAEPLSRRPVELLFAIYLHVTGLLILGVFSKSIVSKALRGLMDPGVEKKTKEAVRLAR